jgi:hypothetical protein
VPRTIRIRVDDEVYAALCRRAEEAGITVADMLRSEAARLAARPTVEEWLARTRRRPSDISRKVLLATLDEARGPWPDTAR